MAIRREKTDTGEDIVIDGFEKGIAPSPQQGIANMQGVNISTEMGEAMCSYARVQQSQTQIAAASFTVNSGTTILYTGTTPLLPGTAIVISGSSGTPANGTYFVVSNSAGSITLSSTYQGATLSGFSGAGGSLSTTLYQMSTPVQAAVEQFHTSPGTLIYRYYILDVQGLVWVYDPSYLNGFWALIDKQFLAPNNNAGGIAIFNGWIHVFVENVIYVKETILPGVAWGTFVGGGLNTSVDSKNSHFALVTQNNTLTYCDGPFVGTIESSSNSGSSATAPIWSYGSYTFVTTTLTVLGLFGGALPINNSTVTFTTTGTLPSTLSANTRYYVVNANITNSTFSVSATVGGGAISLSGGSGTQYFNTYSPTTNTSDTFIFSPQALSLPFTAVSQSLCEIGNTVVVGTQSNFLYFWDEVSPLATNFIPLPEDNASYMINVNNMAYVFAGNKGNIYITNGSTASAAISIPDYCAGIPGTPSSYIEPYFVWGGAAYIRGRVYFSILDQTGSKAGNCGGIWSFIPTQNLFAGQDVGLALRLEAQNSYGSYNGVANVLLNSQLQNAIGPQYWSFWSVSGGTSPTGIDFSGTTPYTAFSGGTGSTPFTGSTIIETDGIPVGTLLNKTSFEQIEYKLSTPLVSGEHVGINYRANMTDAWLPLILTQQEASNPVSGIFTPTNSMQNLQWVQLQVILSSKVTNPSFTRLRELRLR